jgi:hypothetical protein
MSTMNITNRLTLLFNLIATMAVLGRLLFVHA